MLQAPRSKFRVQITFAVSGVLGVLQAAFTHSDTKCSWSHSSLGGRWGLVQSVLELRENQLNDFFFFFKLARMNEIALGGVYAWVWISL